MAKQNPCLTCVRVDDPSICENKNCKLWKSWFLQRWNQMHNTYKDLANKKNISQGTMNALNALGQQTHRKEN